MNLKSSSLTITPTEILTFWFGAIDVDGLVSQETSQRWWQKNLEFDQLINDRFLPALNLAAEGGFQDWLKNAKGRLALIILLDQFSRNCFRDTAKAFTQDPLALEYAREGIALNQDKDLALIERVFFYIPFEHSESAEDQETSVQLFKELAELATEKQQTTFNNFYDYAIQHKKIIDKFGRYPHRNQLISRSSTPEELEFLKQPGSSF